MNKNNDIKNSKSFSGEEKTESHTAYQMAFTLIGMLTMVDSNIKFFACLFGALLLVILAGASRIYIKRLLILGITKEDLKKENKSNKIYIKSPKKEKEEKEEEKAEKTSLSNSDP